MRANHKATRLVGQANQALAIQSESEKRKLLSNFTNASLTRVSRLSFDIDFAEHMPANVVVSPGADVLIFMK